MGFWDFLKPKQSKAEVAGQCFNSYQSWFSSLDHCDEEVDITLTIRLRAFGNGSAKQAAWKNAWADSHGWGPAAAGVNVSSNPPELWMDLRMSKAGIVLPPHVLGHEFWHSLHNKDKRIVNPDSLVEEIY